jgi:hypothetical protein
LILSFTAVIPLHFLQGQAACYFLISTQDHFSLGINMIFTVGQRSDVHQFKNNWDRADCWTETDFIVESGCFSSKYFFSRHFTWGDESSVGGSWAHWSTNI